MKKRLLLYLSIFILITGNAFSQKKQMADANKKFNDLSYIDAISVYERVAEKGYQSVELFQKLGDSYYFNSEFAQASKWYGKLFQMKNPIIPAQYYYRYSQSLKSVGDYEKAASLLVKFNEMAKSDARGQFHIHNKNYLDVIKSNSGRYTIKDAGINSEYSDFGSTLYGNKIVFASARDTGGLFKREHKWTNKAFLDLFVSEVLPDSSMSVPVKFSKEINTRFNESTPVFTKDGNTMYFTRNNFTKGKKGKDKNQTTLLKVYRAVLKEGAWTEITELPFNSDAYNVAHPALSADEKTLYFASDMPGSLGQSDLFKVTIEDNGTFGVPQNLGPSINTEGKETFPFLSAKDELYFASDGHPGLGGLDVFMSRLDKEGNPLQPLNVGEPINSSNDDFAFSINTETGIGFFSSYRAKGAGLDDIYRFKEHKVLVCEQSLSGVITDAQTGIALANAQLVLLDVNMKELGKSISDASGAYGFEVECGKVYYVRASKADYETNEAQVTIAEISGKSELSIALEKVVVPFSIGEDIAKKLGIKKIYFDLGKSFIRPDAAIELAKVLEVMIEYPTMKIDVRSHTDSRDSHKNNEKLSDRRAKATAAWFIEKGIASDRISGKGYGETQLINHCADGVKCTEEEHQLNRRSEFIIIAL